MMASGKNKTPKPDPAAAAPPRAANQPKASQAGTIPPTEEIKSKYLGLKVLAEPEDAGEIDVDIVAVPGIAVHPMRTWVHRKTKVNWLMDETMLPAAVPRARIAVFGYKSYWFGDDAVKQSLHGVAGQLLCALDDKRKDCRHRPIIFIGHCFGGLVVQCAYKLAYDDKEDHPGIFDSVTGIIFLGTPHRGVVSSSGLQTQGQIYQAIVRAKLQIQDNALHTMAQDNDLLLGTVTGFTRLVGRQQSNLKPMVYCFYEQVACKVGLIAGIPDMPREFVVGESSATLDQHGKEAMALDHFGMNKFEDNQDGHYDQVRRQVVNMAEGSKRIMEERRLEKTSWQPGLSPDHSIQRHPQLSLLPVPIEREAHFAPRGGVLRLLQDKFEETAIVALTGDLGTGKTHVAVEYAHKFYREHPGSPVYWVDASSSEQFELSYQRIAQALHLASSSGVTRTRDRGSDVLKQVYHALKRDGNGQWLMVLDGLNDESALQRTSEDSAKSEQGTRESMLDFVAKPPFAQVLVTTRDKALAMRLVNQKDSYVINVPGLKDEDAALVLLGKVTTDAAKVERAARVSQALGGSAGALTFAYRYHKKVDSQCSWRRYLDKIQRPESTKSAAAEPGTTAACARRAWQLLYESLQEKHPETASLLRSIGVLDIQSIPRVFFSKSELSGHVRRLIDYGMVEPSADQKVLRVTAIVRRCVQSYLEETKELALVEDKILSLMCDKFDGKDPDTAALLLPTVLATLKFQPSSPAGNGFLATLLFKVAEHYANTGRPQIALRHLERCLILRKENPETRQELIEETQRALDDSRDQLALAKTGETTSAPKPYTPAVADTKRPDKEPRQLEQTTGVHQDSTIRETSELASAQLMQAQGKPEDTVALYQRILDWGQSNYGSNNIDTARFQYNLALAHEENGEYDKAEALYLSASQVIEQHLGPGSPELLRILRSLSCMWCRQGNLDAAERGLSAVLQGQQTAPGMGYNHPETLVTRQNIAMLLEERGQTEAAGAELERVVGLQAHLLGRDHRATLQTACSLAGNYGLRGRRGEAEWLFRETLRAQERTLGKRDRDTVTTAAMLEEFLLRSSSRTVTGADRQHPKMAEVQGGNRPKGSNNNSKGTGALTKESSKTQEQAAYEGILC